MTIADVSPRIEYAGAGSAGPFAVPFYFLQEADLLVYVIDDATDEATLQTLSTDYTVTGEGDEDGGAVTLVEVLAAGTTLRIDRSTERTQESNWGRNDPFPAVASETAHDKLTMIVQELELALADMSDRIDDLVIAAGDLFDTKIVAGYNAIFKQVQQRNTASTSTWDSEIDSSGNWVFDHVSGLEGALVLNAQGDTTLGLITFRTQVVSTTSTTYTPAGQNDKARVTRFAPASAATATIPQDSDVADINDRFFDSDWFVLERANAQTLTLAPGSGVTLTNAYTGATGSIACTKVGGQMLVRRVTTNSYRVWGDIPQREVHASIPITSASGVLTIDWALGSYFTVTLTEDVTSVVHSNLPSGVMQSIIVRVTQHGSAAKTVTGWAAGTKWPNGVAPTITATLSGIDEIGLDCAGDSTTVLGKYLQAYS